MDYFLIEGGKPLAGDVVISGAKNAALPILAASLLVDGRTALSNVPSLNDVRTMLGLLRALGGDCVTSDNDELAIDAGQLDSFRAPYDLVKTMRASILVMGPLLARYGRAEVSFPGGCSIGSRPVDLHLKGFEAMGAEIEVEDGYIIASSCDGLKGCDYTFDTVTVGGTENLLMAATLARGKTVLRNAAREPEITDLIEFLRQAGAQITGDDTDTLEIEGLDTLSPCSYSVMPDRIEAGTFLMAAAATRGTVNALGAEAAHLGAVLDKLREAGASVDCHDQGISLDMKGRAPQAVSVTTAPYPGFPTDMQAQLTALNIVSEGTGTITETIFENRLIQAHEMARMGADIIIGSHSVTTTGGTGISGAQVMASDLRASASLVIAGLAAQGTTRIDRIYHIDRGYERIEEKLQALGGDIIRRSE